MQPSDEQASILETLATGQNVVVDAVAGSGKTTTIVFIAERFPDKRILILTYNQKLKEETRHRLADHEHVDVHNYHSLVHNLFKSPCHDDKMMSDFLADQQKQRNDPTLAATTRAPSFEIPAYDLIVLDEVQDMTMLFYQLVYFLRSCIPSATNPQLCCLGDRMQCIYQFMKADERFITSSDTVFNRFNTRPWCKEPLPLVTTFRMAAPTTTFLNQVLLRSDRLHGYAATGLRPLYIHANLNHLTKGLKWIQTIVNAIRKYGAGNTFILAPSLRSPNSPVRKLENFLVQYMNVPCYVPTADERELNRPAMSGKVVFSTFHQSKGMERDLVIVYGVDDSPMHRYTSRTLCDNKLYVAMTRSRKQLIAVHDESKPYLPYMDLDALSDFASVISDTPMFKWLRTHPHVLKKEAQLLQSGVTAYPTFTFVTNILRHCHFEDLTRLEALMCTYETIHPAMEDRYKNSLMTIPNHVVTNILPLQTEEVSDLTGLAMQAWIELKLTKGLRTIGHDTLPSSLLDTPLSTQTLLLMVNDYDADGATGYRSRRRQIQERQHNWVSLDHLNIAWENFTRKIDAEAVHTFEVPVEFKVQGLFACASPMAAINMIGRIDVLEKHQDGRITIWELKFVSQVQSHHIVQAATYGILYFLGTGIVPDVYVYNLKTDHLIRVHLPESVEHALDCLRLMVYLKFANHNTSSDAKFLGDTDLLARKILESKPIISSSK